MNDVTDAFHMSFSSCFVESSPLYVEAPRTAFKMEKEEGGGKGGGAANAGDERPDRQKNGREKNFGTRDLLLLAVPYVAE